MEKNREMDTWIDKVTVIRSSFMQDIEQQPVKRGSVLFRTDVAVFYVTMLRVVTNHMSFIYVEKPLNGCVDTFSVMKLWVLLINLGGKCLMHFHPMSALVWYL